MRSSLLLLLALSGPVVAQVGTPFCPGDVCPCGNLDGAAGCGNAGLDGDPATGATLDGAAGTANVFADDLVLSMNGIAPGQTAVLLVSSGTQDTPFGDGRLCLSAAGGGRLAPRSASAGGNVSYGRIVSALAAAGLGPAVPGATLHFQGLYRDPGGPCGTSLNLTSALSVTFTGGPIEVELAAVPVAGPPFVHRVQAFNEGTPVSVGLDPERYPALLGATVDAYVVAARSAAGWDADPSLVDVRGGPTALNVSGLDLENNVLTVDAGILAGPADAALGARYDLVVDVDGDGLLSDGDLIDGRGDESGFSVFRNLEGPGPYTPVEILYAGPNPFQGQNIFYPAELAALPPAPLVVVSHGNGHNYQWYDHIGLHLASYGYVVMSHQNDTMPGPNAASLTTLDNVDHFLGNLDVIGGGVLEGEVDASRMVWFGHSRGGEGIVRAYDRIFDGTYTPQNFTLDDIALLSSIAPTNFLGVSGANPHGVSYHLWTGAADADVSGGPETDIVQTFQLLERAENLRLGVVYQGVGHGAFHNGGGSTVATGPCQVGRQKTHRLMRGLMLPLIRHFVEGEQDAYEWLWRSFDSIQPLGAPSVNPECIVVGYEVAGEPGAVVIDDHQSQLDPGTSSSGTAVTFTVQNLVEQRMDDLNTSFGWTAADPMNGMTRASSADDARCVVFDWDGPATYRVELPTAERNLARRSWLAFRACQGSRHPQTVAALEDLTFDVVLEDSSGREARLPIEAYGGGVDEPYQRTGSGGGAGWGNEFETFRLRLDDFRAANPELALHDVVAVRLDLGAPGNSPEGRLGLDDLVLIP